MGKARAGTRRGHLKVIDVDPGSGCSYSPLELNDPSLLAQNALETDADWAGGTKSLQAATHVQIADNHIDFLPE